jgi:uncharacterized protein (TIGR02246 family)
MNTFVEALLICLTFALQAPVPTDDEAAVREVVRRYVDARERSAAKDIEALFTADADQLTSSGEWRKGRDAIVRGTLASSKGNPGTRTITIETVRFPAPGVAIADGRYEIAGKVPSTRADGSARSGPGVRRMWTSFVMVRVGNTWQISAIRNMLPAAQ